MKLLLDLGNTRCKWGFSDSHTISHTGAIPVAELAGIGQHLAVVMRDNPQLSAGLKAVCLASVGSSESHKLLLATLQGLTALEPWCAVVQRNLGGVEAGYTTLPHLGVDRWLALLAAWKRVGSACLVISAGSALTVDYLDDGGKHQGGLIAPGVQMMRQALFDNTRAVKVEPFDLPANWILGRDTLPCVAGGLSAMMQGLILEVRQRYPRAKVLLTGGDAGVIASLPGVAAEVCELLVLEGLSLAHSDAAVI